MEVMTRELGVMDAAAISLCKENDLPIIVLNIQQPGRRRRARSAASAWARWCP